MIPADIIKKLTPEQLRQARRLYMLDGEVFFREKPDGTLEVIESAQVAEHPTDQAHIGSWDQSSKFNG
jgi:hypothetical protein